MKTWRSKIAIDVLTLVKKFFDSAEFRNQPERIKEYVHWALWSGGPAYYETPVPMLCTMRKDDPNYPVSFFYHQRLTLMLHVRSQMAFCTHNCQDIHEPCGKISPPSLFGTKEPTEGPLHNDLDCSMLALLFAAALCLMSLTGWTCNESTHNRCLQCTMRV